MIKAPELDWYAVAPEVVLAVAAIVVLLVGMFRGGWARFLAPALAIAAFLVAGGLALDQFLVARLDAFAGQVDADSLGNAARILACAAGALTVLHSLRTNPGNGRAGEHYALLLAAVCGMGLFATAGSLVSLFVGLELFSIALYVLCALEAERVSSLEAGLKYLIVGGLASAFLLYGSALVYGATGTFDLGEIGASADRGSLLVLGAALLIAALAFKASAAPLHWWTPDVYDGAPTTVTAFMATATKVAAFLAMARVLVVAFHPESSSWEPILAGLATVSIVVGNLGAIAQERIKRMLAYSSIAHAGYLLIGIVAWERVGIAALVYALIVYVAMTLGTFALVLVREHEVGGPVTYASLQGTGWGAPSNAGWLAALPGVAMVLFMLSLAGFPPTAGFFAKFGLFDGAVDAGYAWLAIVGVLGSAVSLVYYLRVPVVMFMGDGEDERAVPEGTFSALAIIAFAVLLGAAVANVDRLETPAGWLLLAGVTVGAVAAVVGLRELVPGMASRDDRYGVAGGVSTAIAIGLAVLVMVLAFVPGEALEHSCVVREALVTERAEAAVACGRDQGGTVAARAGS